jgi:DNA-damage-inducible protein J
MCTTNLQKGVVIMAQATITARVDEHDKIDFDAFCSDVGLNTSTAINLFVKAVLREKRIPFEIMQNPDPFYSTSNQAYVMKSVNELKAGKGKVHELIEVEDE